MGELLKATLQEVSSDTNQTTIGDPVPVQFNPASLKLKLTNQTDGGRSRGRQRRQHSGSSSTVLSMDLIFDTADEGTDAAPVSVRSKTSIVEKYVLPKDDGSETPPRLQFQWDQLIIAGVVESVDIDFEHFAATGAPLRAKVSLSIKEQEPKYTFVESARGPAARDSNNAQAPGNDTAGGTSPGSGTNDNNSNNSKNSDRSDPAMEGETAPDFLARHGLDPAAWRGLDVDLSASLSLQAGIEVGFSAGLSASAGIGVSVGVQAKAGVSLEAALGVNASAVFAQSASASENPSSTKSTVGKKVNGDSAGLALSASGGVQSAMEILKINETQHAVAQTQSAFGVSTGVNTPAARNPDSSGQLSAVIRQPLQTSSMSRVTGGITGDAMAETETARQNPDSRIHPIADPRSVSYGHGVPLQPLYAAALTQTEMILCANDTNAQIGPKFRKQKTTAPWVALPQRDKTRALGDQAELKRRRKPCDYLYHPCKCD